MHSSILKKHIHQTQVNGINWVDRLFPCTSSYLGLHLNQSVHQRLQSFRVVLLNIYLSLQVFQRFPKARVRFSLHWHQKQLWQSQDFTIRLLIPNRITTVGRESRGISVLLKHLKTIFWMNSASWGACVFGGLSCQSRKAFQAIYLEIILLNLFILIPCLSIVLHLLCRALSFSQLC